MSCASLLLVCLLPIGCRTGLPEFPWPRGKKRAAVPLSDHVRDLAPGYRRSSSTVLVRRVTRPTRANLDHAAYRANCMLRRAPRPNPDPRPARVPAASRLFGGALEAKTVVSSLGQTPLSAAEKRRPMAFAPMVDYLARGGGALAGRLQDVATGVREESWGLRKQPGTSFQKITAAYLHHPAGGVYALWVKIEFEPWAHLFEGMEDEDGDGHPEVYARVKARLTPGPDLRRLLDDYLRRPLSTPQVHAWANELASYWYPSFNTDVVKLGGARAWPLPSTEPAVVAALGGLVVKDPTVVIRGKPRGSPIYNVFVVPGIGALRGPAPAGAGKGQDPRGRWLAQLRAASVSPLLAGLRSSLEQEARSHGGWSAWAKEIAPYHRRLRASLRRRPAALKALRGRGGFLFYRESLRYVLGGEIQAQKPPKNPFGAIVQFKDYLRARGVDFLLVPVPAKPEVFPDRLRGLPPNKLPILNPHGRKFLLELIRAGVEVVDLLPLYHRARIAQHDDSEPLYQPQDSHWTDRGLQLAAAQVVARIRRYPWFPVLQKRAARHSLKEVTFRRFGDLHSRLTAREQRRYKPALLHAHQVLTPAGKLYEDDPNSPIVILGDSFTGVYQRTYCRHAGVSAHMAHELGLAVDLVMSYGGGPNVRQTLLTRGPGALKKKRLLIWLFAARDLYDHWEGWTPLEPEQKAPRR